MRKKKKKSEENEELDMYMFSKGFFFFFFRINDREVELKWKGKALLPTKSEIRILCSKQISEAYLHCRAHNYTEHSHWLI